MFIACGTGVIALLLGIIIGIFLTIGSYNFDKERAELDKERSMANTNWKEIDRLLRTGRYELTFTPNLGLPLLKLKDVNTEVKEEK